MIRPASLLRSDSTALPVFTAPASNIKEGTIDCGITAIPFCLPSWFHQFATPKVFLVAYVFLGICQGSLQTYFAASLKHVGDIFQYSPVILDWLLVSHNLFLAVFGMAVAHWGNKIHRAAWLGGITCLQGAACFLIIIPYLEHRSNSSFSGVLSPIDPNLCKDHRNVTSGNLEISDDKEFCVTTLVVLFILQLFIGLGNASFHAHGFSYIDDNVDESNSPVYLAVAISIRMSSLQFGSYAAWSFMRKVDMWWIGYPLIGTLLIISGIFVAMFPFKLLSTVVKQTAASILDIATGNSMESIQGNEDEENSKKKFWVSFKRIITNKIVVVNTLSTVFMFVALDNFQTLEPEYMESQYYIPSVGIGFQDPWISRLLRNILKPPIVALTILVSGLIIAKFKPRTTFLAGWSVIISLIVALVYISYIFIDCEKKPIDGDRRGQLLSPFCSRQCNCAQTARRFEPVCTQNSSKTFFSPCHAGCKEIFYINDIKVFQDCTCNGNSYDTSLFPTIATEGACDNANCAIHWKLFQAGTVLTAALIASGLVGNLLIILRAVLPCDKAIAIMFELCVTAIAVHIPGKLIYKAIADATCYHRSNDKQTCLLHNSQFGDVVSILTACLLIVSAFADCGVLYYSKDIKIFPEDDTVIDEIPTRQGSIYVRRSLSAAESESIEMRRLSRPRSGQASTAEREPLNHQEMQRNLADEIRQRRSIRV